MSPSFALHPIIRSPCSAVRTLARGSSEAQYCELDVVPGDLNRYTLTGCLPQRSEPLPLAFAIQDGASYAGAILKAELARAGITYSGTLLRQTLANEPGTVLATSQSAPLHDLLRIMLKKSDNMIADTVFRTIGHARFGVRHGGRAPMPYGRSCVNRLGSISAILSSPTALACRATT